MRYIQHWNEGEYHAVYAHPQANRDISDDGLQVRYDKSLKMGQRAGKEGWKDGKEGWSGVDIDCTLSFYEEASKPI
jgi:hypothetical protein